MLPFRVLCEILYGELSPDLISHLDRIVAVRQDAFRHAVSGGLYRFRCAENLGLPGYSELYQFRSEWSAFNGAVRANALGRYPRAPILDMWSAVEAGRVTEEQLLETLDEMLFANLDVTIGGIAWNFAFLGAYPEVQERLRSEITEFHDRGALRDYINASDSYLACCILESSRLRPIAAFSVPQSSPSAHVIDGYLVPPGVDFIVDAYALNVRGKLWEPDGSVYCPERFQRLKATDLRYAFWRFGFGPRQCLGKHIVEVISRCTIVQVLLRYELGYVDEGTWGRDESVWIACPDFEIPCVRRDRDGVNTDGHSV